MLHERLPVVTEGAVSALERGKMHCKVVWASCSGQPNSLDRQGFISRPQWRALQSGVRPPPANDVEPGEWAHGWQHYATSASEHHFRESVVLAQSCPSHQAHLRSHSGNGCSHVFCGCPTQPEFRINPDLFRVLILERLRVPFPVTEARCECGAVFDCKGRHRAACPHSGRLRTRALAPERTLARVCREAGALVRCNVKLVDMNIAVAANDQRAIEVVASGLPVHHGAQLAVDITLRCSLTASGLPHPGAAVADGVVCRRARADKERKYTELHQGDRCRLVVVALKTGGRWSPESVECRRTVGRCTGSRCSTIASTVQLPLLAKSAVAHARHLLRMVFCMFSGGTDQVAIRSRGHRRVCA